MNPIRLADYQPPAWRILHTELRFELDPECTRVHARLQLARDTQQAATPLCLHGEELDTRRILVDGRELASDEYRIDAEGLHLPGIEGDCILETDVAIKPSANTRLEGLYCSGPMLLTQCEAQGFRRITWFLDQPDVLSTYAVELQAEKRCYPVLLSNGNPDGAGELGDGRHFARWVDPHPKPSYLFAIAAGDIGCVMSPFTTMEGRPVEVRIWAEHRDVPRCEYALEATLRAMRWDEQRFGRCYDLDQFNIIAAQDFTMGAMENKGLNIFNARYILADPRSATDADYEAIESVIGHEYFHNWSGNRVTLRDWFQLSLKEGLTVFRDQEFTSDLRSRGVKRIDDVRMLRARQFVEDAGALAHPVRPQEYTEINNFYTATVYEKGAEVVRMLHTLLGEADFRRGLDRYFDAQDGRCATVEDLLAAMSAESGRDLAQFKRWYDQAGTPELRVADDYDAERGIYSLVIEQHTAPTPGESHKQPLHIPLAFALYDEGGARMTAVPESDATVSVGLIELREPRHVLTFRNCAGRPLPAFLQSLSAPVRLHYPYRAGQLARLVAVDADPLLRWDAMQRLASTAIIHNCAEHRAALLDAYANLLGDRGADPAFIAECLLLPDVTLLADQCEQIDFDTLIAGRDDLLDLIAETHDDAIESRYLELAEVEPDALTPRAAAARRLKNVLLPLLSRLDPTSARAHSQFESAGTLTDRLAALASLLHFEAPSAAGALSTFRREWRDDLLVTDKWIGLVGTRPQPEAVDDVRALIDDQTIWHPTNPNRVRAVLGGFARSNPVALHRRDGAGYALFAEQVIALDAINPQISARLLTALEQWKKFDGHRRALVEPKLRETLEKAQSNDLRDVAGRLLAG